MSRRPFRAGLFQAAFTLALAACGSAPIRSGAITLVDDAGDTVRLARPAVRVASLIPATTEVLFAIGAGAQTVGRTTWCDWPAAAAAVPNLGDGIAPSVEAILQVRPDLVLLYRSPRNAPAAERLRALGIPVLQLRTDTFEDFARYGRLIGRATGHAVDADTMLARADSLLAALARPPESGPRVLLLAWDQPPMTIGRGSFLHELATLAGARNVFGHLTTPDASVSLEAIVRRDPDFIITTSESPAFARRPEWQVVRAVRQRHFITIAGSAFARPGPRSPEALRRLEAALDSLAR